MMKILKIQRSSLNPCQSIQGIVGATLVLMMSIVLTACSSTSTGTPGGGNLRANADNPANRITVCKSIDRPVANQSQCLQDDAACYEIANGGWCTGPRGNICPAGSQAMPAGTACPTGSRCFRHGESLECQVQ